MADQQASHQEMSRALELADGYLHEAQDVLWTTASDLPAETKKQQLEKITENIWTVQHQLNELQREVEP